MEDVPRDVRVALENLGKARDALCVAQERADTAKRRLISKLQSYPFTGSHPCIQYHIVNTEERTLTEEERSNCA
jgi:hypothetical protein